MNDHIDHIMAVMQAAFDPAFGEAWSRRQVEDALLKGNCRVVVIDCAGGVPGYGAAIAGFALLRAVLDEEELLLFAIDPAHRRQGLGAQLLQIIIAQSRQAGMRKIFLEMRRGNSAERLYARYGFVVVGHRPDYYRSALNEPIDAASFALSLVE